MSVEPSEHSKVTFGSDFRTAPGAFGVSGNKKGLSATFGNVKTFAALKGMGMAIGQFKLKQNAINPPHTHLRATELIVVTKGKVVAGFVDSQGNVFVNTLQVGDVTVFPRGLLHFQLNLQAEEAQYIGIVNSETQGAQFIAEALFKLPDLVKETALQISHATSEAIEAGLGIVGV